MIEITSTDIEKALFVVAAVSTDKIRGAMQYLLIETDGETSRLVATDGHRCHFAKTAELYAPGLYKVVKKTKKELILAPAGDVGEFPDYKRITPSTEGKDACASHYGKQIEHALAATLRSMPSGAINIKYFTEACALGCEVYFIGDLQPIVFKGTDYMAVVMPMRD